MRSGGNGIQRVPMTKRKVDQAPHHAVDTIHTLSLVMAVGPIAAIILALWLIKPADARR